MGRVTDLHALDLPATDAADWVRDRAAEGLSAARAGADALVRDVGTSTRQALVAWDEVGHQIDGVAAIAELYANVHPDEAVRELADQAAQDAMKLSTALELDRDLYEALSGLDPAEVADDPEATRVLQRTLRDFRRAGVDRDDDTRARIARLREELTVLDQDFSKAIRDDVRSIRVEPARLAGLPQDWLDLHPVEDGLMTITTDYPDFVPVRTFAHDADLRRELTLVYQNRGYPENDERLRELFAKRHELATLLGYEDWPSYDAEVKMIGSGPAIPEFIEKITAAAEEPMRRDLAELLARYREDHPDASEVQSPDSTYYEELLRKERYDVDAQVVRTYFAFPQVHDGLLSVTGRLFGLTYTPVEEAGTWHEDVTSYDVHRTDDGALLGRIHLDLHPRAGKYNHAAQFTLAQGIAGRQLPEGVLVCNFPRGLMEHTNVVTLFHEFGHLLHHVLGGHGPWSRFSGVATEWDFVEAPSQMLEQWAWDATVLAQFAHDESGTPIPADLVARMVAAHDYGKGIAARTQMYYAAISYYFHAERPDDLGARAQELQERYSAYPVLQGSHFYASFGHLGGYSSAYYTYMWSLVIAKDLFSAFDPDDLFDTEVAGRYRDRVLARGGADDAAQLVADFLGRPYTFDGYAAWLAR